MDMNKASSRPVGPASTDSASPSHSSRALQSPLATNRRSTMVSEDDFYNAWEAPSQYPRIPNVYEPIEGFQPRAAHNTNPGRDKARSFAVKLSIEVPLQSTSAHPTPDLHDWHGQRPSVDDQDWSVTAQPGSSYTRSDDFNLDSRKWHSNHRRPVPEEQRRARRQSSLEKWMSAGDKIFCHSSKLRS
ncbi:hypothetical protein ACJZ2D_013798 [Fusarium nematophilum]